MPTILPADAHIIDNRAVSDHDIAANGTADKVQGSGLLVLDCRVVNGLAALTTTTERVSMHERGHHEG